MNSSLPPDPRARLPTTTSGFSASHRPPLGGGGCLGTGLENHGYTLRPGSSRETRTGEPPSPASGCRAQHGPLTTLGPMTFSPDQGTPVPGTHCARHNWSCITSGSGSEFAFLLSHSSARPSAEGRGPAAAAWSSVQARAKAWEWSSAPG